MLHADCFLAWRARKQTCFCTEIKGRISVRYRVIAAGAIALTRIPPLPRSYTHILSENLISFFYPILLSTNIKFIFTYIYNFFIFNGYVLFIMSRWWWWRWRRRRPPSIIAVNLLWLVMMSTNDITDLLLFNLVLQ